MDTKEEFIQVLTAAGSAPKTVAAYRSLLGKFEHKGSGDTTGATGVVLSQAVREFL